MLQMKKFSHLQRCPSY
uniref:Uncharacterized protein n=1 Tax=Rhizophora mucronata TaxID=61149 RepID=A0A2P2PH64_RHIMU